MAKLKHQEIKEGEIVKFLNSKLNIIFMKIYEIKKNRIKRKKYFINILINLKIIKP